MLTCNLADSSGSIITLIACTFSMGLWCVGSPLLAAIMGHMKHPNVLLSDLMSSEPRMYQSSGVIALCMWFTIFVTLIPEYSMQVKRLYVRKHHQSDSTFTRACNVIVVATYFCSFACMLMLATRYEPDSSWDCDYLLHILLVR